MGPIGGMVLKPEQLSEMFGAIARPAATLSREAAIDAHFNILFNHSAPSTHGPELAPDGAAQGRRDQVPLNRSRGVGIRVKCQHSTFHSLNRRPIRGVPD